MCVPRVHLFFSFAFFSLPHAVLSLSTSRSADDSDISFFIFENAQFEINSNYTRGASLISRLIDTQKIAIVHET